MTLDTIATVVAERHLPLPYAELTEELERLRYGVMGRTVDCCGRDGGWTNMIG